MKKGLLGLLVAIFCAPSFSGTNIFSIVPTHPLPKQIISARSALAYYKVTNNTNVTLHNTGVRDLPAGVSQQYCLNSLSPAPDNFINCEASFDLAPGASCVLHLEIDADAMTENISYGPKLCQNNSRPAPPFCSTPGQTKDILNITKQLTTPATAPVLSLSTNTLALATGVIESIVVTNTSSTKTVNNIQADFSSTTLRDSVEVFDLDYTEDCVSLAPGESCTLSVVSYSRTAIPSTNFTIHGANSQNATVSASVSYAAPNPLYTKLHQNILTNSDLWDTTCYIMSAPYAYTGIQGITMNEQAVTRAGSAWNIISTPGASNIAYTGANDATGALPMGYGYPSYYKAAIPICFNCPVLPETTTNPRSYEITLNTGEVVHPIMSSIGPNYFYNERACVVLLGNFGNRCASNSVGAQYPTKLAIVDNGTNEQLQLVGSSGPVSAVGLSITTGNSYDSGSTVIAAKLSVMSAAGQDISAPFNNMVPNDGIALYGAAAQFRLRMFISGGMALAYYTPSITRAMSLMPTDYNQFFQIKVVANGVPTYLYQNNKTYTIPGFGDIRILGLATRGKAGTLLNDAYTGSASNQIDIVLQGDSAAMALITDVIIPSSGTNPETGDMYQSLYNPGASGNNPTPGLLYTSGTFRVEHPVTIALSDPRTVNYP